MGKRLAMLVATMALVVASCGGGTVETAAAESDAVGTGIGVHGAWTVTVVEPDGSIASTTEFTNALTGAGTLKNLLIRKKTIGSWEIALTDTSAQGSLCGDSICRIGEPQATVVGADSTNLDLHDNFGSEVLLSGSVEAINAGEIGKVATSNFNCVTILSGVVVESQTSPEQCAIEGGTRTQFTATELDPIPVAAGQIVQVEVEISFGTLTTP